MTTCLWSAVELLERAVAYTRGRLATLPEGDLSAPTPCSGWDLATLLFHMDDALSAFIEGSREVVSLAVVDLPTDPVEDTPAVVSSLHRKACTLLGAWADPELAARTPAVRIGDHHLDRRWLAAAGALEIAVHGWDVGASTGHRQPLPDELARALLARADDLVAPTDRGARFGPALAGEPDEDASARLLHFLGRRPTWPALAEAASARSA